MSLKYLSARKVASNKNLSKQDLKRLPVDAHDDLRVHLSKGKQIELWDGEYKCWHYNGLLKKHCWFNKNGLKDGEHTSWYRNGQLAEQCWYKNNKWDGEYKQWWDNGQLSIHCWYVDGKRDGKFTGWFDDGQLMAVCWFKDGKQYIKKINV